jgi:peptidoglycan/LPS O-acetylase OafA/YrhL
MINQHIHLAGLNGIRAIAGIAVVVSHINLGLGNFNLPAIQSLDLAGHGVTMFFALSGFLITYLLLHEQQKQEINIKRFYLRRILRIWPLYFLYLFTSLFVAYQAGISKEPIQFSLFYYVFLAANIPFIFGGILPFIGHLWSIGVEEQFYLFWPWIIKKTRYRTSIAVIAFAVVFFILRLTCRFIEYKWGNPYSYLAIQVTRFDCMAIGGIGAILFYSRNRLFKKIVYLKIIQILAWLVILLLAFNKFHIASVIDPEIISIVTLVIIVNVCNNPDTLVSLDNKVFNFLGKISYGIYVIHPLIIFLYASILNSLNLNSPVKYILVYTGVLFFTIVIAYLSYEFYEKRFIKLKEKFSVVKSSGINHALS